MCRGHDPDSQTGGGKSLAATDRLLARSRLALRLPVTDLAPLLTVLSTPIGHESPLGRNRSPVTGVIKILLSGSVPI